MSKRSLFVFLILLAGGILTVFSSFPLLGQTSSPQIQETHPASEIPISWKNPVEKCHTPSGLSFLYQADPSSEITVVQIMLPGGKHAVSADFKGIGYMTLQLAIEMPSTSELFKMMNMGSGISCSLQGDYSIITVRSLSSNLENTLKVISGIIKEPLFSSYRIDILKELMVQYKKNEEDSPEKLMELTYLNAFFGKTEHIAYPYTHSIYGDSDSLKKIGRKDILHHYKEMLTSSRMVITVSSDLEKKEISGFIDKYFGSIGTSASALKTSNNDPVQASMSAPQPIQPVAPLQKRYHLKKEKNQSLISFGIGLPRIDSQNYIRGNILEYILGMGMGSRLWELRTRYNLAYSVNAHVVQFKEAGLMMVYLKTDPSKKDQAYNELKNVLMELYRNGVGKEELETACTLSKADFLRENESKIRRTSNIGTFEVLGIGYKCFEDYFSLVDKEKTNIDEFNRYLKDILAPDKWVEVIIGK